MQAEAGQKLEAIVARKERERQAGNGIFLWGVGNAPSTAIKSLARLGRPIPVVFSAMKSKPKLIDSSPTRTLVWRRYIDERGVERPLPTGALVTSRGDSASGAKTKHYALMCLSDAPLEIARGVSFDPKVYRNVGGKGAPVGASQVTALLRRVGEPRTGSDYEANIVAWLTDGYWVKLSDPRELDVQSILEISNFDGTISRWMDIVDQVRGEPGPPKEDLGGEEFLL